MEFLGEILPLLIFILIPIIRGLNNSKKQKMTYEERRRQIDVNPPRQSKVSPAKPWRSVLDEVKKDIKEAFQEEEEKKNLEKHKHKYDVSPSNFEQYKEDKEKIFHVDTKQSVDKLYHANGVSSEWKKEEFNSFHQENLPRNENKTSRKTARSLEFSKNPIVQGIIFAEVIGPPKAKKK